MHASGTFTVDSFTPTTLEPAPADIASGLPVGVAIIDKQFTGDVEGRSTNVFTAAFDQATGVGTYVAMETFTGSLAGTPGSFVYAHAATTHGSDRAAEHFAIVPTSGTGELATIAGTGGLRVDDDGTHHVWFDYTLDGAD